MLNKKTKTSKTKKVNSVDKFEHPLLASDIIVLSYDLEQNGTPEGDHIFCLLVKRKNAPYKNMWALPGGFLDKGETISKCAVRELKEETNFSLEDSQLRFVVFRDDPKRDSRGRVISAVFATIVAKTNIETNIKAGDDAKEIGIFSINEIMKPEFKMAFDHKNSVELFLTMMRSIASSFDFILNSSDQTADFLSAEEKAMVMQEKNPN